MYANLISISNKYLKKLIIFVRDQIKYMLDHQLFVPPRYNWNIVESGVKRHNLHLFVGIKYW
jgi:hypothetical protein